MAEVFVGVADALVGEFDLLDFLNGLAQRATEISGSPGVGVLLSNSTGGLTHVAASSEDARILELLQLQHEEGPCIECYRNGKVVVTTDLATSVDEWPHFAPQALAAGITRVYAFPMQLRDDVLGAVNVFGRPDDRMTAEDMTLVQSLAHIATIAIVQERALSQAELVTEQLQRALDSRVVIEQAKGAVAAGLGVEVEDAFTIIRDCARRKRMRLTDLARAIVDDPASFEALAQRSR